MEIYRKIVTLTSRVPGAQYDFFFQIVPGPRLGKSQEATSPAAKWFSRDLTFVKGVGVELNRCRVKNINLEVR